MTKTHDEAEASRLAAARAKVSDTAHAALDTANSAIGTVRDAAGDAYAKASDVASSALAKASDKTHTATGAAAAGIEANPLVALIGGLAAGAIAGALIPRSQKEAELLGPVGAKLGDAAREALAAAKEAGFGALDEAGFNKDAVLGQVDKLLDSASKAATAAGGAAVQAVRPS